MKNAVEHLAREICSREQLSNLMWQDEICLEVKAGNSSVFLIFQNSKVICTEAKPAGIVDCLVITGSQEAFIQLFEGKVKLREGIKAGMFAADWPFRTKLALEAIFYLAKPMKILQ